MENKDCKDYHIDMICTTKEIAETNLKLLRQRKKEFEETYWGPNGYLKDPKEQDIKWRELFESYYSKYYFFDIDSSQIEEKDLIGGEI